MNRETLLEFLNNMILHTQYSYNEEFSQKLAFEFTAVGSDKSSYHGYEDIYSHLLSDMSPASFLEIGLFPKLLTCSGYNRFRKYFYPKLKNYSIFNSKFQLDFNV